MADKFKVSFEKLPKPAKMAIGGIVFWAVVVAFFYFSFTRSPSKRSPSMTPEEAQVILNRNAEKTPEPLSETTIAEIRASLLKTNPDEHLRWVRLLKYDFPAMKVLQGPEWLVGPLPWLLDFARLDGDDALDGFLVDFGNKIRTKGMGVKPIHLTYWPEGFEGLRFYIPQHHLKNPTFRKVLIEKVAPFLEKHVQGEKIKNYENMMIFKVLATDNQVIVRQYARWVSQDGKTMEQEEPIVATFWLY